MENDHKWERKRIVIERGNAIFLVVLLLFLVFEIKYVDRERRRTIRKHIEWEECERAG